MTDLHQPLLQQDDYMESSELIQNDNETNIRPVCFCCWTSIEMIDDENSNNINTDTTNMTQQTDRHYTMIHCFQWKWILYQTTLNWILPILLYIQFYIAHHMNLNNDDDDDIHRTMYTWNSIQISILLFIGTIVLFRSSCKLHQCDDDDDTDTNTDDMDSTTNSPILYNWDILLPDIMIDILLFILLWKHIMMAVVVMEFFTVILATCAICNSCYCTIRITTSSSSSDTENNRIDHLMIDAADHYDIYNDIKKSDGNESFSFAIVV